MSISVTIDHREKLSGLPDLLASKDVELNYKTLKAGDYLVNHEVLIERKTATDFVLSVISGRLFRQCSKLRSSGKVCLMIVEGDVFATHHDISVEALNGAMLSVMVRWQIPVYLVRDKLETTQSIVRVGLQNLKTEHNFAVWSKGSRKSRNSQVYFLCSLPSVGPQLALRLLRAFGSLTSIFNASKKELTSVEGIGKQKAEKLFAFFNLDINGE